MAFKLETATVAAVQMGIELGNKESNLRRAENLINRTTKDAHFFVLPELFTTGYYLEYAHEWAEPIPGPVTDALSTIAAKRGSYIIGSILEQERYDKPKNTCVVIDPNGKIVAKYSKTHLFRLAQEDVFLSAGDSFVVFNSNFGKMGLIICYDLRFPEVARHLALNGTKIMFVPAEWPHPRMHPWRTLLQARAIENQFFVVGANRVGSDGKNEYFGSSMLVNPFGDIISEGGDKESVVMGEVDFSLIEKSRNYITCYRDRRSDLY